MLMEINIFFFSNLSICCCDSLFSNTQNSVKFSLPFQSKMLFFVFEKEFMGVCFQLFCFDFFSFSFHKVEVLSHTLAGAIVNHLSIQDSSWKLLHKTFPGNMQRQELSQGTAGCQFNYDLVNGHSISLDYCENNIDNCLDEQFTAKTVFSKYNFLFSFCF